MRYFRMVVYERVWLGLAVKGGGVTGGPVKQVMSVKEGKGMFSFRLVCFQVAKRDLGKCYVSVQVSILIFILI